MGTSEAACLDALREATEVDRCVVLCANCHRREHFEAPSTRGDGPPTAAETR